MFLMLTVCFHLYYRHILLHTWKYIPQIQVSFNSNTASRSRLTAIQLLGLVKSSFISSYGMDAVLKPIIDDVKQLVSVETTILIVSFED